MSITKTSAPTAAARRRRREGAATRTITAAIYTRLSLDRSGEGTAVARQLEDAKTMAQLKGWDVPDELIFTDNDISATTGKERPAFERLLKAIAADRCQAVVVWHMDRLVRLTTDLLRVIEVGKENGFSITGVHGPTIDMSDPTGVAVAQILTAIAEMEGKHKAERQFRANLALRENGVMPWQKCFGYEDLPMIEGTARRDNSKIPQINEEEAAIVREVFTRFNAGSGVWTIMKWLNAEGVTNTRGTAWTRQQVRDMLSNPRFIAKSTLADGVRSREIIGDGNWQPIVSEGVFRTAVNKLNDPARLAFGRRGSTRKWLGAGFYRCGVCGSPVVSWYSTGSAINPETGKKVAMRIYKCSAGSHIYRQAEEADEFIKFKIAQFLSNAKNLWERLSDDGTASEVTKLSAEKTEQTLLLASLDDEMRRPGHRAETIGRLASMLDETAARIERINLEIDQLGDAESPELARLALADDPGEAWLKSDVNTQIAAGKKVCESITLMPLKGGRRPASFNIADSTKIKFFEDTAAVPTEIS